MQFSTSSSGGPDLLCEASYSALVIEPTPEAIPPLVVGYGRSLVKGYTAWLETEGFYISQEYDIVHGWTPGGKLELQPIEKRVLEHCLTPGPDGKLPYTLIIYSCPKKSGKTTIGASVGAWYAEEAMPGSEIYCLANDQEQAQGRVYLMIDYHNSLSKRAAQRFKFETEYRNGTKIMAVPAEYRSQAGGNPGLSIWDELWGYTTESGRRLWAEMTIPPTVNNPLKFVVTYAGHLGESDLLYDLYQHVVKQGEPVEELKDIVDEGGQPVCFKNGRTFAYWDTVPRMPWQTPEYYEGQIAEGMRMVDFLRLHKNQWVTSEDAFVDIKYWDDAVKRGFAAGLTEPIIYQSDHPFHDYPISVGVDAGTHHDCAAVVGCYFDVKRGRVGLALHRIWEPPKGGTLDLDATVQEFLLLLQKRSRLGNILYDPTQLHMMMTNLRNQGLRTVEFNQSSNTKMSAVSQNLYDILTQGHFEAYRAADMRDHLRFAVAKQTPSGFRITKEKHAKYKIDGTIALAMAAFDAINRGGTDVSVPITIRSKTNDGLVEVRTAGDASARFIVGWTEKGEPIFKAPRGQEGMPEELWS